MPALLRNSPQSAPPAGWPAIRHESATLRVFCHLDGQGPPPGSLTYEVDDLSAGFLPIGAFHRVCAGALGCTQRTATGATASLERNAAWVVFGKEHVLLRYVPEESSILVTLSNDGQNGAAATVTDQLRGFCEELARTSTFAITCWSRSTATDGTLTSTSCPSSTPPPSPI